MTDKDTTELGVYATDGFRYITFKPPIDASRLVGLDKPKTTLLEDTVHTWEPTWVEQNRDAVSEIGFQTEAFWGSDQTLREYIEYVALHIGGVVSSAVRSA